jgi:UDP-glucose 4-epimerase
VATTWLVTGGGGFIGSNLVAALVNQGRQVRVLDNFLTGFRENLAEVINDIELVEGDIRDAATCRKACQGVEVVFHEAAVPSITRSMKDPQTTFDINVIGTFNVLMAAREQGVGRVVYAASSSAYGTNPALPKVETMPMLPVSPYAASKAAGELFVATLAKCFGLETVSLRYFNVFGPQQDPTSQYSGVIAAFSARMLRGEAPIVFGDGMQSRDFTFIENVVQANLLAASAPRVGGECVNIGCGQSINLNHVIATLNDILDTHLEPIYKAPRPGEVKDSRADVSAAKALLNYEPRVAFAEGLRQTVDWYRQMLKDGPGQPCDQ